MVSPSLEQPSITVTGVPETSACGNRPDLAALPQTAAIPPLPPFAAVTRADGPWFEELGYTFWNIELLDALADRLRLVATDGWLELAAGTGRLTAELSRRGMQIVATDDHSQSAGRVRSRQRIVRYGEWVECLSAREAVERYRPVRVICAWPPLGSCLVPDLLTGSLPGSERLQLLVCIGDPGGATEAPVHPGELPEGWTLESWPECEQYLVGFIVFLLVGFGFRSSSRLMVYRRV